MAVSLESAKAGAAVPARIDRREAEARKDKFMFELEKAMFAAAPKRSELRLHAQDSALSDEMPMSPASSFVFARQSAMEPQREVEQPVERQEDAAAFEPQSREETTSVVVPAAIAVAMEAPVIGAELALSSVTQDALPARSSSVESPSLVPSGRYSDRSLHMQSAMPEQPITAAFQPVAFQESANSDVIAPTSERTEVPARGQALVAAATAESPAIASAFSTPGDVEMGHEKQVIERILVPAAPHAIHSSIALAGGASPAGESDKESDQAFIAPTEEPIPIALGSGLWKAIGEPAAAVETNLQQGLSAVGRNRTVAGRAEVVSVQVAHSGAGPVNEVLPSPLHLSSIDTPPLEQAQPGESPVTRKAQPILMDDFNLRRIPAGLAAELSQVKVALAQLPVGLVAAATSHVQGQFGEATSARVSTATRAIPSSGMRAGMQLVYRTPDAAAPQITQGLEIPEPPVEVAHARAAEGKPFEKRAMHVFLAEDGIHAWIRDGDIDEGQLRSVAQALAAELAASGRSLAGLTVNGKAIDMRQTANDFEEDDLSALFDENKEEADSPIPSTRLSRKGNS